MQKVLINSKDPNPTKFGKTVLLKFEIYLRLVAIIFAIIVFSCISNKSFFELPGYDFTTTVCLYNYDTGTCNYGISIGVITFLSNFLLICVDVGMELVSVHQIIYRIIAVIMVLFNITLGFNWFVLFCLLLNHWNYLPLDFKVVLPPQYIDGTQAAIAFSFFSLFLYIGIDILGMLRVIRGSGNIGDANYYNRFLIQYTAYYGNSEGSADGYESVREET